MTARGGARGGVGGDIQLLQSATLTLGGGTRDAGCGCLPLWFSPASAEATVPQGLSTGCADPLLDLGSRCQCAKNPRLWTSELATQNAGSTWKGCRE